MINNQGGHFNTDHHRNSKHTNKNNNNNNNSHMSMISLESMLDDEEGSIFLGQFLTQSHNTEPYHFICQVNTYTSLHSHHNRYMKAQEILDESIRPNSKYEINISADIRHELIAQFDIKCSVNHCPKQLFEQCVGLVMIELKEDVWPRFIKSTEFKRYVRNKQLQLQEQQQQQQSGVVVVSNGHVQEANNSNSSQNESSISEENEEEEVEDVVEEEEAGDAQEEDGEGAEIISHESHGGGGDDSSTCQKSPSPVEGETTPSPSTSRQQTTTTTKSSSMSNSTTKSSKLANESLTTLDETTFSASSQIAFMRPPDSQSSGNSQASDYHNHMLYSRLTSAETLEAQLNMVKEFSFGDTLRGEELKLTQKTPQYECYVTRRPVKFNEEDKALKMWKLRLNLPYPIDTLFHALVTASLRNANDGNLYHSYQIDSYVSMDPRFSVIVTRELYRFGYGFTDRDVIFAHTGCEEVNERGKRRIIIVSRAIPHESEPVYNSEYIARMVKSGTAHLMDNVYGSGNGSSSNGKNRLKRFIRIPVIATRIFEEVDDNLSYYYETGYMDMKGRVPAFLWNILVGKRGSTLYAGVYRSCQQYTKMKKENPYLKLDSLGTVEMIEHNRRYMAKLREEQQRQQQQQS